jgi:hypothetical protein
MATNGATDTQIISGVNGSGSYLPLSFYTNNALAAQLTTAGNLTVTGSVTATGGFVQGATAAPAFRAYLSAGYTVSLSTYVKIAFNTESFDTNNNFDSTTNYRFTPTVAGYYQINYNLLGSASTTGAYAVIFKNGGPGTSGSIGIGAAGIGQGAMCSGLLYMNGTTDYIEAYAYITGNGAISGSVDGCSFSAFLARSA